MNPCLCQLASPGRPKLTIAAHFSSQHLLSRTEKQLYFLKDKSWEEVRSGIFEKVTALDKLKLDGVLPMIGLRMDCALGNRVEIVATPQAVGAVDHGEVIVFSGAVSAPIPGNCVRM